MLPFLLATSLLFSRCIFVAARLRASQIDLPQVAQF
jgi:hypothetical protein